MSPGKIMFCEDCTLMGIPVPENNDICGNCGSHNVTVFLPVSGLTSVAAKESHHRGINEYDPSDFLSYFEKCGDIRYDSLDGSHVHCTLENNHIGNHRCDLGDNTYIWVNAR